MNDFLNKNDINTIYSILENINMPNMQLEILIALLSMTFEIKYSLKNREKLYNLTKEKNISLNKDPDYILSGL